MNVFFYGLFMDQAILAGKGIMPGRSDTGYVDGMALRIGERATLVASENDRSYGVLMGVSGSEIEELYAENSVADYVAEPVTVTLANGSEVEALCYNLPADKISGTNEEYAGSLLALAERLGFPDAYLEEIRRSGY